MPNRSVFVDLIARTNGYLAPVKAAAKATDDFAHAADQAVRSGAKGWDDLARGVGVAGAGILAGVGLAVKSFIEFDKQMSAVGAASNATASQMQQLRASALQAGKDTKFSATEAAAGQEALAKAGVGVADIVGGALTGALNLAAAGNLDVAGSAEVAASAMTTFGLKGTDVSHIADLLAAAAGKAQGEVSDMAFALRQSSAVAAQMGLSVEQTTGALAMFASAGLTGSDAGTSFKQMLLSLIPNSARAADAMEKYGLSFFTANGELKSFTDIAGELQQGLGNLTQEQQASALKTIFGADAYRVAAVAMKGGAAGAEEWAGKVNDAGYAAEQAAKKMDNLAGDWEKLTGSLETALIQSGSGANGALRGLTQAAEGAVNQFAGLPGVVQQSAMWMAAGTGAAVTAAGAYGMLAPKVQEARDALDALGPSGQRANKAMVGAGKAAGAAVGILLVSEAAQGLVDSFKQAPPPVEKLTASLLEFQRAGQATGAAAQVLGSDLDALKSAGALADDGLWSKAQRGLASWSGQIGVAGGVASMFGVRLDELSGSADLVDQSLAQMQASGRGREAEAVITQLGVSAERASALFPKYTDAIMESDRASRGAFAPTDALAGRTDDLASASQAAEEAVKGYVEALKGITATGSVMEATIAYEQALSEAEKAARGMNGATKNQRTEFDLTAKSGQEAASTLLNLASKGRDLASAALQVRSDTEDMNASLRSSRKAFIATAVDLGLTRKAAGMLATQLGLLPVAKSTDVTVPGAKKSAEDVGELRRQIRELTGKIVAAKANGASESSKEVKALRAQLAALHGKVVDVFLNTYKRNFVSTVNNGVRGGSGNTLGGVLPGKARGGINTFAAGGIAELAGPGTLYQWAEPETGGEAFIPRRGDKQRSRAIASTVVEDWLGGKVMWPMARGGITSFADGGTTVPLSDFMSRYTPTKFSTATDVTKASRSRANAADSLRIAERRLYDDRRRHASSSKIAADEAAIARARRSLATATEKLVTVQASYKLSKGAPVDRFRSALDIGVKNTGTFLANLQKLADRGFRDMALRLLDMGGPEAEAIAAGAVKLSDSSLRATSAKLDTAAGQQAQLQYFGQISGARAAVRQGQSSFAALARATGSSDEDLAAALKLITGELSNTQAGVALLADMRRYGYAAGGIAPPGTAYRYAEPSTGGEALVPRFGGGQSARAVLSTAAGWYGMQLASTTARPQVTVDGGNTYQIQTVPHNPQQLVRELETAKRWRSGRH
jgi:TP901 family phage tail tape measure protein